MEQIKKENEWCEGNWFFNQPVNRGLICSILAISSSEIFAHFFPVTFWRLSSVFNSVLLFLAYWEITHSHRLFFAFRNVYWIKIIIKIFNFVFLKISIFVKFWPIEWPISTFKAKKSKLRTSKQLSRYLLLIRWFSKIVFLSP